LNILINPFPGRVTIHLCDPNGRHKLVLVKGWTIYLRKYTPLNIYNGTTFGCPTRDLRATVTDKSIK